MVLTGYELNSAKFTPDGRKVLTSCSWYDCALLWCIETGTICQKFAPHNSAVLHSSMSCDMSTVATASWDGALILWWADGTQRRVLTRCGEKSKLYVAFDPKGERLVSAGINHVAQIWPLNQEPTTLVGHGNSVACAEWSADGEHLVTGSCDTTAKVWDASGRLLLTLQGHQEAVRAVAFAPRKKDCSYSIAYS